MQNTKLEEGLEQLGLGRNDSIISLLLHYMDEIELFNKAYGLVKVKDREELIVRHILDSLAPVKTLETLLESTPSAQLNSGSSHPHSIADIGSGAGLPGIPLAICMSDNLHFTLIERMGRRAGFLRDALAFLSLPFVHVEEADINELAIKSSWAGKFDLITFRAFAALETELLDDIFKLLSPGGHIAAYKGRRETIENEIQGILSQQNSLPESSPLKNIKFEIIPLEVPFLDEERNLVIISS